MTKGTEYAYLKKVNPDYLTIAFDYFLNYVGVKKLYSHGQ